MATVHSKQVIPATISRGALNTQGWANVYGRYGRLTTVQMRRLANWGIPGAAKQTLIHMVTGHPWSIVNPQGKVDDNTKYYTDLLNGANDGMGGADVFLEAFADDLLCAREGGMFEIALDADDVPGGIWNIDASTMQYNSDPDAPAYTQRVVGTTGEVYFGREEIAHALWHPFTEIYLPMQSRTPIQLAYLAITVLANSDDWNLRTLNEAIPQGILNLGMGFNEETALGWKANWDAQMLGGRLQDIGLLWGTDKVDWKAFNTPPRDMGFENSNFWYSSLVAACFEMSVMDISIMNPRTSRGNMAETTMLTRRQGLRHLLTKIARAIEHYLLPPEYKMQWEGLDPRDQKADAEVRRTNAQTLLALIQALGIVAGIREARRWDIVSTELVEKDIDLVQPLLPAYAQLVSGSAGAPTGKPFQGGAKRDETTPKPNKPYGTEGDQRAADETLVTALSAAHHPALAPAKTQLDMDTVMALMNMMSKTPVVVQAERQEAGETNIFLHPSPVNIPQTVVQNTVQPAPVNNEVKVDVKPAEVGVIPSPVIYQTIQPSPVQVQAAPAPIIQNVNEITVEPAPVTVQPAPKMLGQDTVIERDAEGEMTGSHTTMHYEENDE